METLEASSTLKNSSTKQQQEVLDAISILKNGSTEQQYKVSDVISTLKNNSKKHQIQQAYQRIVVGSIRYNRQLENSRILKRKSVSDN